MIFAGAPVPEVITLVVMMVIGDLMPGVLVTPRQERGRVARLRTRPPRLPSASCPVCPLSGSHSYGPSLKRKKGQLKPHPATSPQT